MNVNFHTSFSTIADSSWTEKIAIEIEQNIKKKQGRQRIVSRIMKVQKVIKKLRRKVNFTSHSISKVNLRLKMFFVCFASVTQFAISFRKLIHRSSVEINWLSLRQRWYDEDASFFIIINIFLSFLFILLSRSSDLMMRGARFVSVFSCFVWLFFPSSFPHKLWV